MTTTHNKLVRDGIPTKISKAGDSAEFRILPPGEMAQALQKKIVEEAAKVGSAENAEQIAVELGDLLEAMEAYATASGVAWTSVTEAKSKKRSTLGGFERRYFLVSSTDAASEETPAAPTS